MKNSFLFILAFMASQMPAALGQAGIEQYFYLQKKKTMEFVPIAHFLTRKNWYAEVRYNYEEQNSFSGYAGKSFSKTTGLLTYSWTPMAGGVIGRFNGGSLGLNIALEYNNFFLYSQSQYTFSFNNSGLNFCFAWSEFGYEPLPWLFFGGSIQHTVYAPSHQIQFGVVLGVTFGKWTFPIYSFDLQGASRYFVFGITHGMSTIKKNRQFL